jgi:jumonji domain-containing protein 7
MLLILTLFYLYILILQISLFPPSDFPNLYYVKRPKGKLQYEYPSTFIRDIEAIDKRAYVFGSSVDLDSPNLALHPKFTDTHPVRAVIEPGETLYIPAFWHHEVQSVPVDGDIFHSLVTGTATAADMKMLNSPTGDYLNMAVNFWFKNLTAPFTGM